MTIKKLNGKERFEAYKLDVYCFHQRVENVEDQREKYESEELEAWGAFDDDQTLMGQILNNHYDFYFDGQTVKTGGIGSVSTYPEYRESGAIREIFTRLLKEAYKNGEVISSLYPFNHKFYRKFGYEVIPFKNEYKMSPRVLKDYHSVVCNSHLCDDKNFQIHRWQLGQSVKPFLDIYNDFAPKFNFSAVRTEEVMLNHMKYEKEYMDRKFSYLFSAGDKALAYLIFKDVYNPQAAELCVEECAWICREGFNAIMNFLSRFSADYGSITLGLPQGIDLLKIVHSPDAYDIEKRCCQHFMVRIVNVKKLFEVIKKPADCNFTIKVEDDLIKENNLALRVTAQGIKDLYMEESEKSHCDLELNIRSLAQLAAGCTSLDEAMLRDDVKVNGNEEMLRRCFPAKMIFVTESF